MSGTRVYLGRLAGSARERDVERFFKNYGKIREMVLKEGFGFIEFEETRDADDAVNDLNGKELCGDRVIVEHAKPPGARRDAGGRDGGGRMSGGRSGFGGGGGGGYGGGGGFDRGGRNGYGGGGGGYGGDNRSGGGYNRDQPMRPRNPAPHRTDYRILVENLSTKVSWQDLKDYMRQAGEVTYADAHKLRPNEGVVEFASKEDMQTALSKLDGTDLSGRNIKLIQDKPRGGGGGRGRRSRSRSDSRGRSRSRSRSASRSRSRGGRKSRSRSPARKSRSKSHSRSPARNSAKDARKSRSRSPAVRNSGGKGDEKSRSRSPVKEARHSRSKSHSRGRASLSAERG